MGRTKRQQHFPQSSNVKLQPASEKKKIPVNCLENCCNEIVYEIFDYLGGSDIYKAFSKQNIHFEDLLNNPRFLLNIKFTSKTVFDHHYEQFFKSNKHHILSFDLANEFIINKFISMSMINSSCTYLQSLVLGRIITSKLLLLLFHLKSLPRLFSLSIYLYGCDDDFDDIYQIIFSLPALKYLKIGISAQDEPDMTVPIATDGQCSSIEYLVIGTCCTLSELTDLLSYTPRLSHLFCGYIMQPEDDINQDVLMKLTNLVHLSINIFDIGFDQFDEFLLKLCSQLKYLNVEIHSLDRTYLDGNRWERLISEKMPLLTKFMFTYTDRIYDHPGINLSYSLIARFTSSFWIERKWILQLSVLEDEILYEIRPYRETWNEFLEYIDIPLIHQQTVINTSSLHSLAGAQINLRNLLFLLNDNQMFLSKLNSLFQTIKITRLDAECSQIPTDLFIYILNLLPNLHFIRIADLPSYEKIFNYRSDINGIKTFVENNQITNLTLTNISNLEQINLIIDLFPRLQYLTLRSIRNMNLESLVRYTLLKIQENTIFHPMILCFFGTGVEYDQVHQLQQMIEKENLLRDYTINRRWNKFYLQWKWLHLILIFYFQ